MASRKILQISILATIGFLVNLLLILGVPAAGGTAVTVEILHDFPGFGTTPQGNVIEGSDGKLYGTTISGGASGQGTVFSMAKNGTGFVLLRSFDGCSTLTDGCNPQAGVIEGSDGKLYGTTVNGGTSSLGTVYRLIGDNQGPSINIVTPANGANYVLNQAVASNYSCTDPSGVSSCNGPVANGNNINTSSVGAKSFTVNAQDTLGNSSSATNNYSVGYTSSGTCNGEAGHAILQPINADGTSIFKQGSTVPAKFRVCDANGVSIGSAGVVSSFKLVQTIAGTGSTTVNEDVSSTTTDTAFRWDATAKQWIFNITTKGLAAGKTYVYNIVLNDGSIIAFRFGLR
jgi:uncharacterized repeat protein (TIGR03803 family)